MTERTGSKGRSATAAPPSVAVITPTRGLIHSRTVESVIAAVRHAEDAAAVRMVPDWWKWAHGLPIPASHEDVTEQGMATDADLLLFVEDDNVLPPAALTEAVRTMQRTGCGIAAVDYPVGTKGVRWDSIYRENGEVLFSGLGITLIDRKVFDRLERPWFDLSRWYGRICNVCGLQRVNERRMGVGVPCRCPAGTPSTLDLIDQPFPKGTGGVDVAFSIRVRQAGFTIEQVPRMVGSQIRVRNMGAASGSGDNDSPHVIEVWDTIDSRQKFFQVNDYDRFDRRNEWAEWQRGFKAHSPWRTGFWFGDRYFGGSLDVLHDPRVVLARETFEFPRRVLELGSLEGGHTVAISRWAENVVGVEGRASNAEKARWILKMHDVTNAEIFDGDLEAIRLADYGQFDLVFNVGVLYHMTEPLKLLAACADAAPNLFLWTHLSKGPEREIYQEFGLEDPLSGLSESSVWLPKDELLDELHRLYARVEVLDETTPDHVTYMNKDLPAITIAAWGAK